MLKRQKILLAILAQAGQPLNITTFVKLNFLLRHETAAGANLSFYDFVPYKYGPFSFALYRELDVLRRNGYVAWGDNSVGLADKTKRLTQDSIESLPKNSRDAVADIVSEYGSRQREELLRNVYERYPWYACRSELTHFVREQVSAPTPDPAVNTAGYEGKSVDGFFDGLLRAGIRGLLDVRANPVSRKYGFARSSLSRIAADLGVEYGHYPEAGIPSGLRAALTDFDSYQQLLARYEAEILPHRRDCVKQLAEHIEETPRALVCMEKDVRCCHRSRLADAVADVNGLPVTHLA